MRRSTILLLVLLTLLAHPLALGQEARRRWEMERQIRLDKFEQVLPGAMRDAGIDLWIVAMRENAPDPLWNDLGRGYVTGTGYYVFTLRGDRVERIALGPEGYLIEESGAYDRFGAPEELAALVRERDPQRVGINVSRDIGPAAGLSHSLREELAETLGEPYAERLVSA
ncbi:MAG: peptidase M24, partial [Gammaproteobacteria bacterium]